MGEGVHILALMHNRRNLELLEEVLAREGFSTVGVSDLEAFDRLLAEDPPVALALIDVAGFDASIWQRCEALRRRAIPFIILSPRQSDMLHRTSMEKGARGLFVKPVPMQQLIGLVKSIVADG